MLCYMLLYMLCYILCFMLWLHCAMLSLPCIHCHDAFAMLLLPCCHCHVAIAMLPLPCCHCFVAMALLCNVRMLPYWHVAMCHVAFAILSLPFQCCNWHFNCQCTVPGHAVTVKPVVAARVAPSSAFFQRSSPQRANGHCRPLSGAQHQPCLRQRCRRLPNGWHLACGAWPRILPECGQRRQRTVVRQGQPRRYSQHRHRTTGCCLTCHVAIAINMAMISWQWEQATWQWKRDKDIWQWQHDNGTIKISCHLNVTIAMLPLSSAIWQW